MWGINMLQLLTPSWPDSCVYIRLRSSEEDHLHKNSQAVKKGAAHAKIRAAQK